MIEAVNRRRSDLVVTTCSPRRMRAVQRTMLLGHDLKGQPGCVGEGSGCRPEVVQPHTVLEVFDMAFSISAVAKSKVGLQVEHLPDPVER